MHFSRCFVIGFILAHDQIRPLSLFRPTVQATLNELSPLENASATQAALTLLQTIGAGVRFLARYQCDQAIDAFNLLEKKQLRTAWVQCQIGKAYFQQVNYTQAREVFAEVCSRRYLLLFFF